MKKIISTCLLAILLTGCAGQVAYDYSPNTEYANPADNPKNTVERKWIKIGETECYTTYYIDQNGTKFNLILQDLLNEKEHEYDLVSVHGDGTGGNGVDIGYFVYMKNQKCNN